MNKLKSIIHFITIFQLISILLPIASTDQEILINSLKADITGDHFEEYIRLEARKFANTSNYFHDISLQITSVFDDSWNIPLEQGYDPEVEIVDLNHDDIADIFYQVKTDNVKNQTKQQLFSLVNKKITKLSLPTNEHIRATVLPHYQVEFSFPGGDRKQIVNIKKAEALYHTNGELIEEVDIQISPITRFEVHYENDRVGNVLIGYQTVFVHDETSKLGIIKTKWHYDSNKQFWKLLQLNWIEKSFT